MKRAFIRGIAICVLTGPLGAAALGADEATESLDRALHRHIRDGAVDYSGIRGDADFRAYVDSLAKTGLPSARNERLAYLINAYNALAIEGILEGLSPASRIGRLRFFKFKSWRVDGGSVSLYDLEHQVLLPLGEPRIHFSIVCASRSCPRLRAEAYTADALENQLEANARAFINDSTRNRFDDDRLVAHLSAIFRWYEDDFGRAAGSLPKYLAKYVTSERTAANLSAGRFSIEWNDYDWSLNEISVSR